MGEKGRCVGIDHIKELVDSSIRNVRTDKPELLNSGRVKLVGKSCVKSSKKKTTLHFKCFLFIQVGDGRKGYPQEGPYDAIHVGAAAPTLPHEVLFYIPKEKLQSHSYIGSL